MMETMVSHTAVFDAEDECVRVEVYCKVTRRLYHEIVYAWVYCHWTFWCPYCGDIITVKNPDGDCIEEE